MTKRYDVVVVGAGPAGSAAALAAVKEGASCLVLEARKFPRYKPCTGGITTRGQRLMRRIRLDPSPVVLSATKFSVFHYRGEELRVPTSTAMTYWDLSGGARPPPDKNCREGRC